MHENAIGAIISGYKIAKPDLFVVGSFNVPSPKPPIDVPKPGGGTTAIEYRFEITKFGCDVSPADQTFDAFADPFALASQQIGIYVSVALDLAGSAPQNWAERIILMIWVEVQANPIQHDILTFSIKDTRVAIDQVQNAALLSIFSHLLTDYLSTVISDIKVPVNFPLGQLGSLTATTVTLGLDALDVQAQLS
jgi:hypothetical protein